MSVWILVFINCIQYQPTEGKYPVKCQVINYKEHFETKKACNEVKKTYKGVDSSCVKVTVWRE